MGSHMERLPTCRCLRRVALQSWRRRAPSPHFTSRQPHSLKLHSSHVARSHLHLSHQFLDYSWRPLLRYPSFFYITGLSSLSTRSTQWPCSLSCCPRTSPRPPIVLWLACPDRRVPILCMLFSFASPRMSVRVIEIH